MKTTKEEFVGAYTNHPPNKWVKFAFKYFSKTTEAENMKLSKSVELILIGLFLVGFLGTVLGMPEIFIKISLISFSALLSILVLFLFSAVFINNRRIKKIAKELGVSIQEYNKMVSWWGDELK